MLTALTSIRSTKVLMVRGRWTSVKDDLWWKTTFGGRRPLGEGNLRWKTTFGGRRPSMEDDLPWKTTSGHMASWHMTSWHKTSFLVGAHLIQPCCDFYYGFKYQFSRVDTVPKLLLSVFPTQSSWLDYLWKQSNTKQGHSIQTNQTNSNWNPSLTCPPPACPGYLIYFLPP